MQTLPVVQTVPVSLGNVTVLLAVGSIKAKVVVKALSVAPWKTSGEAPTIWLVTVRRSVVASPMVTVPLAVSVPLAVRVPVEVTPLVAVISPEIVGVAVQEVGETVRLEPAIVVP